LEDLPQEVIGWALHQNEKKMRKRKIGPAQWFAELNAAYRTTRGHDVGNEFIPSPHSSDCGANARQFWTHGHTLAFQQVFEKFEVVIPAFFRNAAIAAEVGNSQAPTVQPSLVQS
jgi:hypothetical protein